MAALKKKRKGDLDISPFFEQYSMKKILADMRPAQLDELLQLVGVERILESLSAADRRKLKEQLK